MDQDTSTPRCIRCGGPSDELNELDDGSNCPACASRLFESLPGLFHTPWGSEPAEQPEAWGEPREREG